MRAAPFAALAIAAIVTGCSASDADTTTAPEPSPSPSPTTFSVAGTLTLTDSDGIFKISKDHCTGTGGYDDIQAGADVTVYDADGTAVALGELDPGKPTESGWLADCEFEFYVPDVPADDLIYSVEVSHRGEMKFKKEEALTLSFSLG